MATTCRPLYRELSSTLNAMRRCAVNGNGEWESRHHKSIVTLVDMLPSGSGIDNGVTFDLDASNSRKLVFTFGYHHMNEHGMYDGWTQHTLTVTPSFDGIDISISGRNRNDIKEYLHEVFHYALTQDVVVR